jgi:hypothetical protein
MSCSWTRDSAAPCHGRLDAEHSARLAIHRSTLTLISRCYVTRTVFKMATLSIRRFLFVLFPN